MMGTYCIHNIINDKVYIGSSIKIEDRKYNHFWSLRNNRHRNSYLQRSYNKHGENNFEFVVLEEIKDVKALHKSEQFWINNIGSYKENLGYNICKNITSSPMLGRHHSEETKKRISTFKKGIKRSEETKLKISNRMSGNSHPLYGKRGIDSPNYGSKRTKETREKMSKAQLGNTHSIETRNKIKKAKENISEETRQKLRDSAKNRIFSKETRAKISKANSGENNPKN